MKKYILPRQGAIIPEKLQILFQVKSYSLFQKMAAAEVLL